MKNSFDFIIGDINFVIKKSYTSNCCFNIPKHDTYRLVYVLKGGANLLINKNRMYVKKDDIFLLPPQNAYSAKTNEEEYEFCVISFLTSTKPPQIPVISTKTNLTIIREYFLSAHQRWTYKNPGYKLHIRSLIYAIFFRIIPELIKTSPKDSFVDKIIEYLENNYDKKITIISLSDYSGYSPSYLSGIFSKHTGKSPIRMLNEIRIQRAKEFLKTGMFNVSEVAEKCGFENLYYFSNTFKKYTGVSPKQYLK